jgi:hypothetical protein
MNQTDAMRVSEEFLKAYARERPEYWEGYEPKVTCQCAAKGDTDRAVYIIFSIQDGESEKDPELMALAKRAMTALFEAHPELKELDVTYDLSA